MEKLNVKFQLLEDTKDITDKMMLAYSKCETAVKYLKSLNVPEEKIEQYIARIYDFVCDLNYCKNCPGIKNCKKENAYLISTIDYHGGPVETALVPCKEMVKRMALEKKFIMRDFPEELLDLQLRSLNKTIGRKEALTVYKEFLNAKNESSQWMYLYGNSGSGRSYLSSLICVDAAIRGYGPIYFMNTPQRFRELMDLAVNKKDHSSGEFQRKLDEISNARILVLDDFGNEYVSDFIRDTIIYPIISNRSSKGLLTIFTSDFTIDEIETLYATSKAGQLRAKQLCKLIKANAKKEIDLSIPAIY